METQALRFDVVDSLSGILAAARAVKAVQAVRAKRNIIMHEGRNPFLERLVGELGKYQKRTIDEFEKAVEATIDEIKPKMISISTEEEAMGIIKDATNALRNTKEEGRKLVFSGIFPLRMMICWLDALNIAIEAYATIENRMESPIPKRKDAYSLPIDVYSVSMATGILMVRIEEQKRLFQHNRSLKNPADEGSMIDDAVQALAKDMAYLTRIQGQHHLLPSPAQEDLAVFREFLVKNYSGTA